MPKAIPSAVTDHINRAILRLPDFEQSSVNWIKLLTALLGGIQDIEDTIDDVINLRHLDIAVGTNLDNLGTLLGLTRLLGDSDTEYRAAIRIQYTLLYRSGEPESLIDLYQKITGAETVELTELPPASIQLVGYAPEETTAPNARILALMTLSKAAGVRMLLDWVTQLMFVLARVSEADVNGNGPSDINHGYGSVVGGQSDGGKLSRIVV